MKRILSIVFITLSAALMTACALPLELEQSHSESFQSATDLRVRVSLLEADMTDEQTFEMLDISKSDMRHLKPEELQKYLYGNSVVQGTPEELENFRLRLAEYEGYYLEHTNVLTTGKVGLGKVTIAEQGYDQTLVLIFDDGKLFRAIVSGYPDIANAESTYIWTAVGDGAREIVKRSYKSALR